MRRTLLALSLLAFAVRGVSVEAIAKEKRAPRAPKPVYSKDIAPILNQNCASCHRPGEVAPFSLLSYQDAKKRAKQIAMVTASRFMPPWKADPKFGEFHDARYLSETQLTTLKAWAESGAPEGSPKLTPPPPKFASGWSLGAPDAVFEPEQAYDLEAEGRDDYRNFVIPTHFASDRYISAMEVRPGNRAVVHHVLAFLDTEGRARRLDAKASGIGYSTFGGVGFTPSGALGGWAPGNMPRKLPEDIGILLPKGADIVLQVHYHKSGKREKDQTKIGLYFQTKPVDKRLRVMPVVFPFLRIPAGDANYVVNAAMPALEDITVWQVTPHMHLLGKEMTVTGALPNGENKPLVRIPDWDFNWQTTYVLKTPLKLPQGSKIRMTARYDNSTSNPRNPSAPPKPVGWGEQTTDEMCIAFVGYTVDTESLTKGIVADGIMGDWTMGGRGNLLKQLTKRFDKNQNGKLEPEERAAMMKVIAEFMQDNRPR